MCDINQHEQVCNFKNIRYTIVNDSLEIKMNKEDCCRFLNKVILCDISIILEDEPGRRTENDYDNNFQIDMINKIQTNQKNGNVVNNSLEMKMDKDNCCDFLNKVILCAISTILEDESRRRMESDSGINF